MEAAQTGHRVEGLDLDKTAHVGSKVSFALLLDRCAGFGTNGTQDEQRSAISAQHPRCSPARGRVALDRPADDEGNTCRAQKYGRQGLGIP